MHLQKTVVTDKPLGKVFDYLRHSARSAPGPK